MHVNFVDVCITVLVYCVLTLVVSHKG